MKLTRFSLLLLGCAFFVPGLAQQTRTVYLSGKDKDHTVAWDFFCTGGMNSGRWTTIPVPSNWELQGFGAYNYGHDKVKATEKGQYRTHFQAGTTWADKRVVLVFEGVMTDAEVKVNGQSAGPVHQGGFYRFEYPISHLLKIGDDNLLEVTVSKHSADSTVNDAERRGDFWIFGGIYRPVYLNIMPASSVNRVAIDARADGNFGIDIFTVNTRAGDELAVQLKTLKGTPFGNPITTLLKQPADSVNLKSAFKGMKLWNAEYPNLYVAEVSVRRGGKTVHIVRQRFGFRTIELRKSDGIYVNGTKIRLKGVNRHSFRPESGRTLSRQVHLEDIALIKGMNMNSVRMSHYPPDAEFLDLCDSLGLFVLDELTGWQRKYGTPVGRRLVKELIVRDVNHPSILFWDNGNEGGWNTALDNDYALYDPQKRVVLHPWSNFNNIDTKHYPEYSYVEKAAAKTDVLLHTEMIHGLYDGGHGASLEDNWNLIRSNPRHAGAFLWSLADEGVVRKDKKDSIDTDGNHAPDGIVGPHGEKEGSFYTIREIWSPVQPVKPELSAAFNGQLTLENDYYYTDLAACSFSWQLIRFPLSTEKKNGFTAVAAGKLAVSLAPGRTGTFKLGLPPNWRSADALRFTATDRNGQEINTWTWTITTPAEVAAKHLAKLSLPGTAVSESAEGTVYSVIQNGVVYQFDTQTGYLKSARGGRTGSGTFLSDGPVLAGVKQTLQQFGHRVTADGAVIVESTYTGEATLHTRWTFAPGQPVSLEYDYTETGTASFYGITFTIDQSKVTGLRWLGDGPFRTWKNRLKGVTTGAWEKAYNATVTGETFVYPEFKGYHANLYWARILAGTSSFTVYTDRSETFLQVLQPDKPRTAFIPYVNPPFPEGNLGFLDAIAPIGNKFKGPESMGPQSQKNVAKTGRVSGRLWFDFQ